MAHIDPEILALAALGEDAGDDADRAHLAQCSECASELAMLAAAAHVGRSTVALEGLEAPAGRVWDRIRNELEFDAAPAEDAAPALADADVAPTAPRPVVTLRRRILPALIAAAAAVVLIVGGLFAWQTLRPLPTVQLASATLEPFPDWSTSSGSATVVELPDGTRELRLELRAPIEGDGYREAWLISSDGTKLISLGVVDGETATFVLPAGVDLGEFSLVDVSLEHVDGDPGHSGDSIVRGPLA